jgi:MFS family permease
VESIEPDLRAARRAVIAGSVGNFMEWYDFATYAYLGVVLGKVFFHESDPFAAFLDSFAVYASSYVVRPVGAVILGRLADRFGRRPVLLATLIGMCTATALIGVLPGYATAGVLATVLLVLFRLVQGLSAGGEFGGAVALMAEFAPEGRRGYYGSWQSFTVGLGLLAGSGIATLLTGTLSAPALISWGWRIPFLLAAVFGVLAIYLRRQVEETPVFRQQRRQVRLQPLRFAAPAWVLVLFVIGSLLAWTTAGNVFLVVLPSYAATTLHVSPATAQLLTFVANAAFTVTIPLFGHWSDRIGRRPVMLTGAGLILVLAYPLFAAINTGNQALMYGCVIVAGIAVALMAGPGPAMLAELFPASIRATGLGFGYALSSAAFGGTAALIIGGLKSLTGDPLAAAYYPIVGGVVSVVCLLLLRGTHREPLREV